MRWLLLLLFGGIGLAAFVGGIVSAVKRFALLRVGVRTVGTVVELSEVRSTGRGSKITYYPVVQFAVDGKPYKVKGSTGSSSARYEMDAKVQIVYPSADPSRAQIVDFLQLWFGSLFGLFFGLAFLAAGIGGFYMLSECNTCVYESVPPRTAPARTEY